MNLKPIVHPKRVYEGWFDSYFLRPWIRQYADFHGATTGRDCLFSILAWLTLTIGLAGVLMGLVGLLGPETGFCCLIIFGSLWIAASIVPFAALIKRTLSHDQAVASHPRFLIIDILQVAAAVLFFIFGLLMMLTTLNSEMLQPDPGTEMENSAEQEDLTVTEPIFTYQTTEEPVVADTTAIAEPEDPDLVSAEESFDPTLAPAQIPEELPDSLYF